ncbi:hypothetical protein [Hymenobacter koreensis]|uniref:DUF4294 domain-containing protein n=1 Tax=Hymenobacter koreensis TaxID=1084523 RepID=A0ABP8IYH4_9BACT
MIRFSPFAPVHRLRTLSFCSALLVGACVSLPGWAQQTTPAGSTANASGLAATENINSITRGAMAFAYDDRYEGVRGTPYVMRMWLPADITLNSNVRIPSVRLKYDALRNHILARPDNTRPDSVLLNPASVKSFAFQDALVPNQRRLFRRFDEAQSPSEKQAFVEVLYEGQYSLLKHYRKEYRKANFKGAYSDNRTYDEVIDRTVYYLRRPNGTIAEVKLNEKSFAAAAPELAGRMKTVSERAQRNLKTESDLTALLAAADKQP